MEVAGVTILHLLNNLYTIILFQGCIKLVSGDKCSADAMSRCTDPLRVVTDNKDLGFATSQEELEEMCP